MDLANLKRHVQGQANRHARTGATFLGRFTLTGARAHEMCGPARRRLALWLARGTVGPILWIRPGWHPDRLHMAGVRDEIAPGRLLFVEVNRAEDLLWSMEEALRAGVVPLVVADLPDPPGLTPVRRLHLAAEAGAQATGHAPMALLLTPGDGGAAGVETRWRLDPAHGGHAGAPERWRLARLRARDAAPGTWDVGRAANGAPEVQASASAGGG